MKRSFREIEGTLERCKRWKEKVFTWCHEWWPGEDWSLELFGVWNFYQFGFKFVVPQ
jgi:hypothetical protein